MGPFGGIPLARNWEMRSREEPFLATNHSQSLNVFQYNIDYIDQRLTYPVYHSTSRIAIINSIDFLDNMS